MNIKQAERSGLRIRGSRGHPEVRAAMIRFAKWLRANYDFPIRMPVYLSPHLCLQTIHGEEAFATFFAPFDRRIEPYIRIATGGYLVYKKKVGRDDAFASYLISLSHEVIHYQQWLSTGHLTERGVNRKAPSYVDRYARTVDHP